MKCHVTVEVRGVLSLRHCLSVSELALGGRWSSFQRDQGVTGQIKRTADMSQVAGGGGNLSKGNFTRSNFLVQCQVIA